MVIREGYWDCSACGATANAGRYTDCTRCGKPRPYGVRFYRSDSTTDVVDPGQLREARAGPDWQCKCCYNSNRALLSDCRICGVPRGEYTRPPPGEAPRKVWQAPAEPQGLRWAWGAPVRFPSARTWLRLAKGVGALAVGLVLLAAGVSGWRRYDDRLRPGVIAETRWTHTVHVEQLVITEGEGWRLPDSAVVLAQEERVMVVDSVIERYEEIRSQVPKRVQVVTGWRTAVQEVEDAVESGTETYVCGSTDLRNGYFEERECTRPTYVMTRRMDTLRIPIHEWRDTLVEVVSRRPVYRVTPHRAPWYRYRAREWQFTRAADTSGVNSPGAWPAVRLRPDEQAIRQYPQYTALVRDRRGRLHEAEIDSVDWPRFRPGDRVAFGRPYLDVMVFSPDSLKPCRRWHQGRGRPPPAELGCSPLPAERLPD